MNLFKFMSIHFLKLGFKFRFKFVVKRDLKLNPKKQERRIHLRQDLRYFRKDLPVHFFILYFVFVEVQWCHGFWSFIYIVEYVQRFFANGQLNLILTMLLVLTPITFFYTLIESIYEIN